MDIQPCPSWALIVARRDGTILQLPASTREAAVQAYISLIGVPGLLAVSLEDPSGNVISEMNYPGTKEA